MIKIFLIFIFFYTIYLERVFLLVLLFIFFSKYTFSRISNLFISAKISIHLIKLGISQYILLILGIISFFIKVFMI